MLAKFGAVGIHYYWYSWRTLDTAIQFFGDAYKAMRRAGLGELEMWATEFGASAGSHGVAETCEYVTAFFNEVALKQAKGNWLWLKLVAWFVFNEGEQWGTYHTLSNANGRLSRIGRRFRDA